MILITSKPHMGSTWHIYIKGGDGKSLCKRAPLYEPYAIEDLSRATCATCVGEMHLQHLVGEPAKPKKPRAGKLKFKKSLSPIGKRKYTKRK